VSAASDVAVTTICLIRSGAKRRIRARSSRRILAVDRNAVAGAGLVDARGTWQKIKQLLEEGFTKGGIAVRLGCKMRALQIRDDFIWARTAMRVDRLYNSVMRE
jgi:hypothetical protein